MQTAPRVFAPLLAFATLATAGCAGLSQFLESAFEKPTLTFQSASLDELGLDGATVRLHYRLDNPNAIGLNVARASYQVELDGQRAVAGQLPTGIAIPAQGSAPLELPVRLRFGDVPGVARTLHERTEVPYRVTGTLGFDTPIGPIEIPFSHEGKLPVPRMPVVRFESARIESLSFTRVTASVTLAVENPNAFALPAGELSYALTLEGAEVARSSGLGLAAIPANGVAKVKIPVDLSPLGAGAAVISAMRSGTVEAALDGGAKIGGFDLPVHLKKRLEVAR
jgi:LEA14-like dessication related protein